MGEHVAKWITGVTLLLAGLAFVIGLQLTNTIRQFSPAIAAQIALQEAAKADTLRAQAAAEWARAEEARARADAVRMAAGEIAAGLRWVWLGSGIGIGIAAVGCGVAAWRWSNTRARVVYPSKAGHWPIWIDRRRDGTVLIADTSRGFSPAMMVLPDGRASMPVLPSEAAMLQTVTQAQAAGVMLGVASNDLAEDVSERVKRASADLPAPTFGQTAGDGLRLVYVKGQQTSTAARELADLREFIMDAWNGRGLARSTWMGRHFAATNNRCTKSYWEAMTERLHKAGCIRKNASGAWETVVTLDDALDAFGLLRSDAEEVEGE